MNPIKWCDITRNYIRGCLTRCNFCYGVRFNARTWLKMFHVEARYRLENNINELPIQFKDENEETLYTRMRDFKPVFMYSQFAKSLPKKPMRIFMDSMSDICWWKDEWIDRVFNKIKKYPQHKFQFLTKDPKVYFKLLKKPIPSNVWFGFTAINQRTFNYGNNLFSDLGWNKFVSLEPLHEEIDTEHFYGHWVIVGGETGNRRNKIVPKLEWIEKIVKYCVDNNMPVFLKDNIEDIWLQDSLNEITGLVQQFPEQLKL